MNRGFTAERVPLSGSVGGSYAGDVTITLLGINRVIEVKVRAGGFSRLYKWLDGRDLLTPQQRAAFITAYARSHNMDPRTALRVAQAEGFYKFTGDHGLSHGDFQLYSGGGLGNLFKKATGLDPSNPQNWQAMDRFALDYAHEHGWGAFHGAARTGIGIWQGIHKGIPSRHHEHVPVHVDTAVNVDGHTLARVTSKHLARRYEHPRRAPVFDAWAGWAPPDMQTISI